MNKQIYNNNNKNKFGHHSSKHNLDICKHHKHNNDLVCDHDLVECKPVEKEVEIECHLEEHIEIVEKDEEIECHLDITQIYNQKAEERIETVETKNIKPKLLAVVQLAVSKAKLDKIIGSKKW